MATPEFRTIGPGEERTFILPFSFDDGTGEDGTGDSGGALSTERLIVGAEVLIEGRDGPVSRHFSFPACN